MNQRRTMHGSRISVAIAIALGLGMPGIVAAQQEASTALEEIIVTAQKREQNVQDVGTSISVLTGDAIQQLGMTDMTSIVQMTPGLQIIQFSPVVTQLAIRGVSQASFADHLEAPIAVYVDEAYIAANGAISGALFDVERIEVLRGPQGTLFGRNATGGLVHYITRKPTEQANGYVSLTGARFNEFNVQGAFGGPIAAGLRGRLAFSYNKADGHLKDQTGPDTPEQNNYFLRGQLATDLGESTEALLSLRYGRNKHESVDAYYGRVAIPNADGLGEFVDPNDNPYGTCPGCDFLGYTFPDRSTRSRSTDGPHDFNRTLRGATLRVTSSVGGVNVTAISDYYRMSKAYAEDTDASPNPLFEFYTDQKLEQFSQEVRLDGSADALRWVAGFYYLDLKSTNLGRAAVPLFGLDFQADWRQKTRSEAAFAQVEYDFAERWTAIVGGRYSMDQKKINLTQLNNANGNVILTYDPAAFPDADRDFNGLSGKIELDFRPVDGVLTYASVNRGYKGGNWNTPVFPSDPASFAHDAEKLTSYEVGFKSTLAGGRVRLNGNVFYYDYKDYQAFVFENAVQALFNSDATLKGGELELTAIPVAGLTLQAGLAALDSKVKDVQLPGGRIVSREMPMAPSTSLTGLARYEWPALGGMLALQVDGKYDSSMYFTTNNAPVEREPSRFVGNARATYTLERGNTTWEVAAFVRNFTDKQYNVYGADLSPFAFAGYTLAPPRVYGATVTVSFD